MTTFYHEPLHWKIPCILQFSFNPSLILGNKVEIPDFLKMLMLSLAWRKGEDSVSGETRDDPVALAGVEIPLDGVDIFSWRHRVVTGEHNLGARLNHL